jgi:hypothetical protein
MGAINNYGISLVPNGAIRNLALGLLNAWTYDYHNPLNFVRDTCVQIRNNADRLLGEYLRQLRGDLSNLRKKYPAPTRENPFPPQELMDAVKEMEQYIRRVEDIRTRVSGTPLPPQDILRHSKKANLSLLEELQSLDRQLLDQLSTMDEAMLDAVKSSLDKRDELLRSFFMSVG